MRLLLPVACFLVVRAEYALPSYETHTDQLGEEATILPPERQVALRKGGGGYSKLLETVSSNRSPSNRTARRKPKAKGRHWAFLVASSEGWRNYRHQADICHAYHTLIKRGISPSNIIVMMKDDIANNTENPYPGKIFNELHNKDVYAGVKIDYRGNDLKPENFLRIMEGNAKAMKGIGSGRVIRSTKHDTVFVSFDDHGAYGVLGFPSDILTVNELNKSIKRMIKRKRFGKLLFYIEACESGSLFDGILPSNKAVLATTAAGRYESSYACYCSHPKLPCLGNRYSVSWTETLDRFKPVNTLFDQFDRIRSLTSKSHVNIYGDYRVGYAKTKILLGYRSLGLADEENADRSDGTALERVDVEDEVPSREASFHWIKKLLKNAINPLERLEYHEMLDEVEEGRKAIDNVVDRIIKTVLRGQPDASDATHKHYPIRLELFPCYERIYRAFGKKCFNIFENDYALMHFYKFYNLCYLGTENESPAISAMDRLCGRRTLDVVRAY